MTSVFLDLETYSTRPDAVVISFAAIAVDAATRMVTCSIELRPCILSQIHIGRHICPDTIAFHRKRGTLADPTEPRIALAAFAAAIADFFRTVNPARVWIQGPDFDAPITYPFFSRVILENLCTSIGGKLPWDFWITRDARTAWDLAFPAIKHPKRPHHAMDDCLATLADTTAALRELNRLHAL